MIVMFGELSYNLAYYKDVIFSTVVCGLYAGIWFRNKFSLTEYETHITQKTSLVLGIITFIFTIITVVHSFESSFYIK